jgi:hypothetical protein
MFTFFETLPSLFFMKVGPSAETAKETQALSDFLELDSVDKVPMFVVIPTVS